MPLFSHYSDIPDISDRLSVTSLFFMILIAPVVGFRLFVSFRKDQKLHLDDYLILLSALCAEALGIIMILCAAGAFGKHIKDLHNKAAIERSLEYFMVSQVLYKLSIAITKLSILRFYERMFKVHKNFTRTCKVFSLIILAWIVAVFFATIFQCTPIDYTWKGKASGIRGSCINVRASWFANAVFNISTDLIIVFLPMPIVFRLQMKLRPKLQLCALFALGLMVCVTSILRATTLNATASQADRTWYPVNSSMWSVCEDNLAIIGACIPTIKGFFTGKFRFGKKDDSFSGSALSSITFPAGQTVYTSITGPPPPTFTQRIYNMYRNWEESSDDEVLAEPIGPLKINARTEITMVSGGRRKTPLGLR
ncbi:hypothetical protein K461DRAFT_233207 [Myriangium duriaei CBS 260.36]|uniref:Rhodopsin domain-containing protein n=1 Tax=Myriangium duriaei CBS 260.36 TaxID=1168546 RepID=A0A9P4MCI7_9PEZI|nr:hypothetical protein K461DRAFT_233207 [Myriangium duriaei CBS 260.36]